MAQKMVPIGLNFFFVFLRNHLSLKKTIAHVKNARTENAGLSEK